MVIVIAHWIIAVLGIDRKMTMTLATAGMILHWVVITKMWAMGHKGIVLCADADDCHESN